MWIEALFTAHIQQKNDLAIFTLPPLEREHLESTETDYRKGERNVRWDLTRAKLKLDDRGRLFPEGWEKKINHDVKVEQIKETPTKKGEGGRTPKHKTL
ncbi:hypothetical protein TNCV_1394551 [Trichonephila clavipes]|nr:hypothetical protein TNCV_1394551 [Trichonephila clavipes]